MAIDDALLQLGKCCYLDEEHPHQGNLVISALCYLWSGINASLPQSWRATRGWSRFLVLEEGQPVAPQRLAVVEEELWLHGRDTSRQAGDAIAVAVDGYLREQDIF